MYKLNLKNVCVGEGRYPLAAADGVPLYIRRPALRGPDPGTVPPGQIRSMVSILFSVADPGYGKPKNKPTSKDITLFLKAHK